MHATKMFSRTWLCSWQVLNTGIQAHIQLQPLTQGSPCPILKPITDANAKIHLLLFGIENGNNLHPPQRDIRHFCLVFPFQSLLRGLLIRVNKNKYHLYLTTKTHPVDLPISTDYMETASGLRSNFWIAQLGEWKCFSLCFTSLQQNCYYAQLEKSRGEKRTLKLR